MTYKRRKRITDKMRLDWLSKHKNTYFRFYEGTVNGWSIYGVYNVPFHKTLRGAIDAAIKREGK